MVTLDTIARSRQEILRVLIRVGHTDRWYSRRGREVYGEVLGGSRAFGDGTLTRVWWLGNLLRLNCTGCEFSELIEGPAGALTVHIALPDGHISEFSLVPNRSVGGSFINLDFPEQDFGPLDAVNVGDTISLVIGDVVK